MGEPDQELEKKLKHAQNIWFVSVRPPGGGLPARPHLAPVWFVWFEGKFYISTEPVSVKARNIASNPQVSLALEDGTHPVICEGTAEVLQPPYPAGVMEAFFQKYDWVVTTEPQYNQVVAVTPRKWMSW